MVVALEAMTMGVPVLVMANDQPVAGFIVKATICLLIPGATVGLIFLPKVALAYGWGMIEGESNPWRFVKGESSGSSNHQNKPSGGGGGGANNQDSSRPQSKKGGVVVNPSLNSLVSGKVLVSSSGNEPAIKLVVKPTGPFQLLSKQHLSKDLSQVASTTQLKEVLDSDPTRRRFRRYLQTLKMDENVRFWDCVTVAKSEANEEKRVRASKAIIQTFVLDSAPLQVNFPSKIKEDLQHAYQLNDKGKAWSYGFISARNGSFVPGPSSSIGRIHRTFMENDTTANLSQSQSDLILLAVSESQKS